MRRASALLYRLPKSKLFPQTTLRLLSPRTHLPKSPNDSFLSLLRPIQSVSQNTPASLISSLKSVTTPSQILSSFKTLDSSVKADAFAPEDLAEALNFTLRAIEIFKKDEGGSIPLVEALRLIGLICCKLKKFDESLEALDTAATIIDRLVGEGFCGSDVKMAGIEVMDQLMDTYSQMGRKLDRLISLKKGLEMKRLVFDPKSREMGSLFKDLAEAYVVVSDFDEALPTCLKALEVLEVCCGSDSVEAARGRQLLSVIYVGLGENDKALEENEQARGILSCLDLEGEVLDLEIESASVRISMGWVGEAIEILKRVIQKVEKESETRAFVFVAMAKALSSQEKFGEAKRCLEIASGILNKLETKSSTKVYESYAEIAMIYEMMNEFETALSLMKRTVMIVERLPKEQHLEGSISARMGWLLLLTGRADQAIPYLERGVKILNVCFGQMHFGLGFVSKHLGQAYLEVGKLSEAIEVLGTAYNIISRRFGPNHEDSIDACQFLANAYGTKAK